MFVENLLCFGFRSLETFMIIQMPTMVYSMEGASLVMASISITSAKFRSGSAHSTHSRGAG